MVLVRHFSSNPLRLKIIRITFKKNFFTAAALGVIAFSEASTVRGKNIYQFRLLDQQLYIFDTTPGGERVLIREEAEFGETVVER